MNNFITENWMTIVTTIGLVFAWFGGRKSLLNSQAKKASADVIGANLNNVSINFKVYQDLITDLEIRFKSRIKDLEEDLEKMKSLTDELRRAISNQEEYIKKLKQKLDNYEELER